MSLGALDVGFGTGMLARTAARRLRTGVPRQVGGPVCFRPDPRELRGHARRRRAYHVLLLADGGAVQTDPERRRQFETIVAIVHEPLQRYLGRRTQPADVAEVLNDSLLVIWRRLEEVPADDPLPWSYGVAKRCLANHRRGSQQRLRRLGKIGERAARNEVVIGTPTPDFNDPRLETALGELDDSDRELVRLWAWEQLQPREIAVVLDTTPNAVSLRLTRAKKKIVSSMERQDLAAAGQEGLGHGREPRS